MRKCLILCVAVLVLLCLAGCGNNTAKEATESELITETSFPAGNTESAIETEAASEEAETEAVVSAEAEAEQENQEAESAQINNNAELSEQAESEAPKAGKSAVQSAVQKQTEESVQTQPTEAAEKTPPKPTQEQTAAVDVSTYVEYAKSYAVSIGLALDDTATACWDNPITANASRSGIKEDFQSRLNRYKNTEGFTAVWIWTEKVSDSEYEIYIGYC